MPEMTYDQWEDFDGGQAIDLATNAWELKSQANEAYQHQVELGKNAPEDKSEYEAWEEACVLADEEHSKLQEQYLELSGVFEDKYGWSLDDLVILDEEEEHCPTCGHQS